MQKLILAAVLAVLGTASVAATSPLLDFDDFSIGNYGSSKTFRGFLFSTDSTLSIVNGDPTGAPPYTGHFLTSEHGSKVTIARVNGEKFHPIEIRFSTNTTTLNGNGYAIFDIALVHPVDGPSAFNAVTFRTGPRDYSLRLERAPTVVALEFYWKTGDGEFAIEEMLAPVRAPVPLPAGGMLLPVGLAALYRLKRSPSRKELS